MIRALLLLTVILTLTQAAVYDTTLLRSEFEKIGDTVGIIPDFKSLLSPDISTYYSVSANGAVNDIGIITMIQEINDIHNEIHSVELSILLTSGDTLTVNIVDGFDYLIEQHGGTVLDEHNQLDTAGDWAVYNNLWGKGSATPNTDFRIATVYHPALPDSTLFVWDVPSEAKEFGGPSVWCYVNLMWGNRYGQRDNLSDFPYRIDAYDSLILDFDYTTIADNSGHKVALNLFTTEEEDLSPFNANDGDFFMVFDQKGTWVSPYPDTLVSDTALMGAPFILLLEEKNSYTRRRTIVLNHEKVEQGKIDLKDLFTSFGKAGFMADSLSIPNIQIGIEVTDGFGAVRMNRLIIEPKTAEVVSTKRNLRKDISEVSSIIRGETIHISTRESMIRSVSLKSVQGRVFNSYLSDQKSISLDISHLSPGVYLSEVELATGSVTVNRLVIE